VVYLFSVELERFEPHKALKKAFPRAACIGASMIGGWCTTGASEKGINLHADAFIEKKYVKREKQRLN
jgi:hypothetical protein